MDTEVSCKSVLTGRSNLATSGARCHVQHMLHKSSSPQRRAAWACMMGSPHCLEGTGAAALRMSAESK